ncbi:MAG TPA: DUF1259 domain-containing protein [Tepidisphaeraceae bacterium]|nr:DUF1259 domain-containing protein [Tepidisphaeraceae bacterium]
MRNFIGAFAFVILCSAVQPTLLAQSATFDIDRLERLAGVKAVLDTKESAMNVTLPRNDLKVIANGVRLTPANGLTCWATFKVLYKDQYVVIGDQILTEDQVNPVMSVALDNGLEVTALHNEFAGDSPRVMVMRIGGTGPLNQLTPAVAKVFTKIGETSGGKDEMPKADIDPAKTTLNPTIIDSILDGKGKLAQGVYKITLGNIQSKMTDASGMSMRSSTWAEFVGSDEQAAIDGDFALHEKDVQKMLKALLNDGFQIVSIHNQTMGEEPGIVSIRYWKIGSTANLAKELKKVLETQKTTATDRP